LIVTYVKVAADMLTKKPDCAPIIHDKPLRPTTKEGAFVFRLLDYVQEPTVVVNGTRGIGSDDQNSKCIIYSISQPRQAVAEKILAVNARYQNHLETAAKQYPLVAIHLRTGWSDEMQRNVYGWDALGSCDDYRDKFPVSMAHHAVADVDLKSMLLDAAAAADRVFGGSKQWRLYVASDGPGIRKYVEHLLESRAVGPIVWHDGRIGHNFEGGLDASLQQKIETSISALTDMAVMSEADMLIALSSKYPRAAHMRAMCPQRYAELTGHPRHNLDTLGDLLEKAWREDKPDKDSNTAWSPNLNEEDKTFFFKSIPSGMDNPCTMDSDPFRSCFCLLKLSHHK
jgi:hypothetical protein